MIGCVPPSAGALQVVGERLNVAVPAACVTVTVCPAMVAVAVRVSTLVVAAAVSVTVPFPDPDAGEADNHPTLVEALQVQPVPAVTPTFTEPPAAPRLAEARDSVGAHRSGSRANPYPQVEFGTAPRASANVFR